MYYYCMIFCNWASRFNISRGFVLTDFISQFLLSSQTGGSGHSPSRSMLPYCSPVLSKTVVESYRCEQKVNKHLLVESAAAYFGLKRLYMHGCHLYTLIK